MKSPVAVCLLMGLSLSVTASGYARVVDTPDVENPARTPFVVEGEVDFADGDTAELGEVPTGKRR